jgi:hypothetical protein
MMLAARRQIQARQQEINFTVCILTSYTIFNS